MLASFFIIRMIYLDGEGRGNWLTFSPGF
jgi:hypothetical protein